MAYRPVWQQTWQQWQQDRQETVLDSADPVRTDITFELLLNHGSGSSLAGLVAAVMNLWPARLTRGLTAIALYSILK